MSRTIGIISIKGGVGKTTVSAALAADLANRHNKKVLLIDANLSAPNLGLHMDIVSPEKTIHHVLSGKSKIEHAIHSRYGVDVIPGSYVYEKNVNPLKLKARIKEIKDNYDFIVIDSSPSMNDEILSTILASDNLFVVSTPDYPTLSCSLRAAKIAKQRGKPITGIILNKIRNPKFELELEEIERASGIPVVARIRDDNVNVKALFTRIPIPVYDKNSAFSKELGRLANALCGKNETSFWRKLFSFNFGKEEVNRQILQEKLYESIFDEKKRDEVVDITKLDMPKPSFNFGKD
ncbi:MAG: MinD/ParA family protein [archaeon]|jgi:septum site-determining protein MinD|nr:MinD/ParA family protein [archaeon]